MDVIGTAKTWIIIGIVAVLLIEVTHRLFVTLSFRSMFLARCIHHRSGLLLSQEKGCHLLLVVSDDNASNESQPYEHLFFVFSFFLWDCFSTRVDRTQLYFCFSTIYVCPLLHALLFPPSSVFVSEPFDFVCIRLFVLA